MWLFFFILILTHFGSLISRLNNNQSSDLADRLPFIPNYENSTHHTIS